ncbi:hypothetical protein TNCV_4049661 [Trichonephila clavipes]|nr:hypothetical protein TNCV_4049661 [Trichonephila clavipes]
MNLKKKKKRCPYFSQAHQKLFHQLETAGLDLEKLREVLVGSMETTNHHGTGGCKSRPVGENHDSTDGREDEEPGEEGGNRKWGFEVP